MLDTVTSEMAGSKPMRVADLLGRSAIVTGSTSGIGLGIARAFAACGMNVLLNGFGDPDEIDRTLGQLGEEFRVDADYSAADMSKPDDISRMVDQAQTRFGTVDVLVNNAGIQHVEAVETFPIAKWDAILSINLSAAFHATRAVVPGMKARGFGRIINVASAHALVASPFKSAYVSAKHGIAGFTKTVALETAEHGITVNAICPGYVLTPLVEKQIPEQAKELGISDADVIRTVMLKDTVDGHFTTLDDVARCAVFLAAFPTNALTGQSVVVSHGWSMQ